MQLTVRQLHPLFVGEISGADAGHVWRKGDLVISDNRRTMRRGRPFDEKETRDLRRATTRDVASTLDQVA